MDFVEQPDLSPSNAANLDSAFGVLVRIIRARMGGEEIAPHGQIELGFFDDGSAFSQLIREHEPPFDAYIVLMLALAPHLQPALLEQEFRKHKAIEGDYPEIGGVRDSASRAFLPTGETAAYLLAGNDWDRRFSVQELLMPDGWLASRGIVVMESSAPGAPLLSGRLLLAREWVERLTLGHATPPAFSESFPAQRIETLLEWEDLILEPGTLDQLQDIRCWLLYRERLEHGALPAGHLRNGYRALFHGPSGTGKTLAASLLGKLAGLDTYRIDLAAVTSKYIGETEKNLAALFDRAKRQNWVLFFDEADALFGKRTAIKDSHDRYANITVSYLLERVMGYDGLAILATNLRGNIDNAFLGRFETFVRFSLPGPEERRRIWLAAMPKDPAPLDAETLATTLAHYELSGRAITGALHTAALAAMDADRNDLLLEDALRGVRKEVEKEGRIFHPLEGTSEYP